MSTAIEWTGETWNPTTGCDRCSPGCDNCYALTMAGRLKAMGQAKYQRDGDPRTSGPGFGLTLHPDALDIPLRRKKPTTWFVNSMSDLFHPEVPDEFIGGVWRRMEAARLHTFQVLTKRPQRMAKVVGDPRFDGYVTSLPLIEGTVVPDWPLPNVWLGTSIESDRYTFRADHLRATPAAVRFLSLEPLLGPLPSLDLTGIDWVITGGESGPNARPSNPDWFRDVRDQCQESGVAYFHKQNGEWANPPDVEGWETYRADRVREIARWVHYFGAVSSWDEHESLHGGDDCDCETVWRVGKKAAGRELDGRTWDEMPEHAGALA